jgi:hypothetical protein
VACGLIRTRLEREGRPIGGNDLLIAAQTTALGYAIVTDNEGEFGRVDGVPGENWLRQTRTRSAPRDIVAARPYASARDNMLLTTYAVKDMIVNELEGRISRGF